MAPGFHEVRLPLRLALGATGGPTRRTDIVALSNGGEARNARFAEARRSYDVGTGLRGIEDLYALVAFFEARQGQLHGFRFRDPLDHSSAWPGVAVTAFDQPIGAGDGARRTFQLTKTYADAGSTSVRRIDKPVAETVRIAVAGAELAAGGFSVDHATGLVLFATAPAAGAVITSGYEFDVPVRFDADRIEINLAAFEAGSAPTVPLKEIRP